LTAQRTYGLSGRWLALALAFSGTASAQVPDGGEFRINTYTTGRQWKPDVSAAADGSFVVVWDSEGQDSPGTSVFGQRFDFLGQLLGAEFQISAYTSSPHYRENASVSAAADGSVVAVWEDDRGGIFGRRYDAAGLAMGPDFPVTPTMFWQKNAAVASAPDGRSVVAWQDDTPGAGGIFGRRYAASGSPSSDDFPVNTEIGGLPNFPAVASAADGRFVVAWSSVGQDGDRDGVFVRRYDALGSALGAQFQVNAHTTGAQRAPSVAMRSAGEFVVVWQGEDQGGFTHVFGRLYDVNGSALGAEFQVSQYVNNNSPDVSLAADGSFVVVWDAFDFGIAARRYDPSGVATGAQFRVDTYLTDFQGRPRVASAPNGRFVVVWEATDGVADSVFGQRYQAPDGIFADGFE